MADIIDEVTEDLRRQQLEEFWKENRYWIIGGAIAAVVLTGAMTFWRQWDYNKDVAATSALVSLISQPDVAKLENFAKDTGRNHAVVARFVAAGLHANRKENDKAAAIYGEIASTRGIDGDLKSLAALLGIGQRLEKDDPAALKKELSSLTKPGNVWRFSALEMEALLHARESRMQDAVASLDKILGDARAPEDVRLRATTLRELYLGEVRK